MGFRRDDEVTEPYLRSWVDADRGDRAGVLDRLGAIEEMISYWIPLSKERDLRIEALEQRSARLEQELIPADYSCVAELTERVDHLEATTWELGRRLHVKLARGESP